MPHNISHPLTVARFIHPAWVVMLVSLLLVAGCDRPPQKPATTQGAGSPGDPDTPQTRIVTLAPALTQMLVDLGQTHLLVGVARNDNAAPAGLPTVGDTFDINTEALLSVKPTLVLMMSTKENTAKFLSDLGQSHGFEVVAYPSPKSVEDVANILIDQSELDPTAPKPQIPSLGAVLHIPRRAVTTSLELMMRLGQIEKALTSAPGITPGTSSSGTHPGTYPGTIRKRVLMVIGTGPLMASGPGTTHHQLLSFLNARNAAEDATVEAPTFDREKLLACQPDVVLLLLPNAPALQALDQDPRLAIFRGLDIPAVKNKQIVLINDPLVLLPSSSLPRIVAAMAKAIHPQRAAEVDAAMTAELLPHDARATQPAAHQPAPASVPPESTQSPKSPAHAH